MNPYNSMNYGSKWDMVWEFVEACREQDLRIGFYSSFMDRGHPGVAVIVMDFDEEPTLSASQPALSSGRIRD